MGVLHTGLIGLVNVLRLALYAFLLLPGFIQVGDITVCNSTHLHTMLGKYLEQI